MTALAEAAQRTEAAVSLLERHAPSVMGTARRYAATPEDAEDAYQRGVEILLLKAPTRDGRPLPEGELLPWLRTVVKHEAWALRRQRQRQAPLSDDGVVPEAASAEAATQHHAEQLDRLRVGAEAMRQLKPQEIRALLLRAEGYRYQQIQELCGWTYTKVNRCVTEGRKVFLERVAAIDAGERCSELATLLERVEAVGEAERATLRAHLRTCLACRQRLRTIRARSKR